MIKFIITFLICFSFIIYGDSFRNYYSYIRVGQRVINSYNKKKTTSTCNTDKGPRNFSKQMRIKKYEEQRGICAHCGKHFELSEMDADHIIPWSKGGSTTWDNLQMLCRHCNRSKSNRYSY